MHWNYRVVLNDRNLDLKNGEQEFVIAEVFYADDSDRKPMGWSEPWVGAQTVEELKDAVDNMLIAFTKPVIVDSETVWTSKEPIDLEVYDQDEVGEIVDHLFNIQNGKKEELTDPDN